MFTPTYVISTHRSNKVTRNRFDEGSNITREDNHRPSCASFSPTAYTGLKLEEQRVLLQREFRDLESQAKEVEKEAHAHSRQSAIGPDGTIIPARARKKRRLDEELEGLLEAMEVELCMHVLYTVVLGGRHLLLIYTGIY